MNESDDQKHIDKAASALLGMKSYPHREKAIPTPTKADLEKKFRMVTENGKARIEEVKD